MQGFGEWECPTAYVAQQRTESEAFVMMHPGGGLSHTESALPVWPTEYCKNDSLDQREVLKGIATLVSGIAHSGRSQLLYLKDTQDVPWKGPHGEEWGLG